MKRGYAAALAGVLMLAGASEAVSQVPNGVSPADLQAYWPMNGSPIDASGNGNHLVPFNVLPTDDAFGNPMAAYAFDASLRSSLEAPDGPSTDLTEAFTWAGCVSLGRLGSVSETISQKSDGRANANSMFQFDTYGGGANDRIRYSVMSGTSPSTARYGVLRSASREVPGKKRKKGSYGLVIRSAGGAPPVSERSLSEPARS